MKNGFGLYDMAGNAAEWLWDSYYSEVNTTTEYLDDNYKGPDLGLGTERFYAEGRFVQDSSLQGSDQAWDAQRRAGATSAGAGKIVFSAQYTQGFFTNGSGQLTQLVPQIGLRTVRGR